MFQESGASEDPGQSVVVPRRDRVELVIMAAGAGDGLRQKGPAQRVQLFVRDIHVELFLVLFLQVVVAHGEERGRNDSAPAGFPIGRVEQITRDLFPNEGVKR